MSVFAFAGVLSLGAFVVRTSAFAFVVEEARLGAGRLLIRRAFGRAFVHDVHDLLVAEREMQRFTHGENVSDVVRNDGNSVAQSE